MKNVFLKDTEDWENNSIIRRHNSNVWLFYVEGYRSAAEKLINEVLSMQFYTSEIKRESKLPPIL